MMNCDQMNYKDRLQVASTGIIIQRRPFFPLCASLFYFRIPPELWDDRIKKVKAAGYNTIDVYFPWNFHEEDEGRFNFSEDRDVACFLDTVKRHGLYVIARPGPYICSEWDGGGLPAWLYVKENIKLRQNDPGFLQYVERWYKQVIPIIRDRQVTEEGPVLLLQVENELDFFVCEDRQGYLAALCRMVKEMGITVPVTACIGKGDLYGAVGGVDGILPTLNLYPEDREPGIEEGLLRVVSDFTNRNLPVIVTETGRNHLLLRRLLSAGVKGLAPFLQVSGTNFGFWTSVNDWKKPLAFLTTDSDFGGMIDPAGRLRAEYYEGRLLAGFISSFTEELLQAKPTFSNDVRCSNPQIGAMGNEGTQKMQSLIAPNGTVFLFPANLTDSDLETRITLAGETFPRFSRFFVKKDRVPIVVYRLPLDKWGIPAVLEYTTSELYYLGVIGGETVMIIYGEDSTPGEIAISPCSVGVRMDLFKNCPKDDITLTRDKDRLILTYNHDQEKLLTLNIGAQRLLIVITNRHRAGRSWIISERDGNGRIFFGADWVEPYDKGYKIRIKGDEDLQMLELPLLSLDRSNESERQMVNDREAATNGLLKKISIKPRGPEVENLPAKVESILVLPGDAPANTGALKMADWQGEARPMETFGLYKGVAWYLTSQENVDIEGQSFENTTPYQEGYLYFRSGSDLVSVYVNGEYLGTKVPNGDSLLLKLPAKSNSAAIKLTARTEIWGHSNFDHERVPALAIGSLRGLDGLVALVHEINGVWSKVRTETTQKGRKTTWTWRPETPILGKTIVIRLNHELTDQIKVSINGETIGYFGKYKKTVEIASHIITEKVSVFEFNQEVCDTKNDEEGEMVGLFLGTGNPAMILAGSAFTDWEIWGFSPKEMVKWVEHDAGSATDDQDSNDKNRWNEINSTSTALRYPIKLQSGRIVKMKLTIDLSSCKPESIAYLIFEGHGYKLTAFLGDKILGRLWLPSPGKPEFAGGTVYDRLYLPEAWVKGKTIELRLLLEAIAPEEPGEITSVRCEIEHPETLLILKNVID